MPAAPTGSSATPCDPVPSILVIDNEPDLRELLCLALTEEGFHCTAVATPEDGLGLLQHYSFALVLTDSFSTTPSDLFSPTAALREAAGATGVVLLTAYRVDEADARTAGFAGVLPKPFDVTDLLTRVRQWTNLAHPDSNGESAA